MNPVPGRGRAAPVLWLALAAMILIPIAWGAAATFPWDVDNIAPGSVLKALAHHFGSGWSSSYGPLPYLIGALAASPVLAALRLGGALAHPSPEWPYGFAHPESALSAVVIAVRLVSAFMAIGVVALAARRERAQPAPPPGWAMPLIALGSATFCYYAHTSNVDMQYLFWLWLAYYLVEEPLASPPRLALGAACAAFAVATKEQAAPLALVAVVAAMMRALRGTEGSAGAKIGAALRPALAAMVAYAIVWQLPFNFSGWWEHHHFVFTQAKYPRSFPLSASGLIALAARTVSLLPLALGWLATVSAAIALVLRVSWRGLGLRTLGCALYLVTFLVSVGYVYPRFLLPLTLIAFPLAARGLREFIGLARNISRDARPVAAAAALLALTGGPALLAVSLAEPRVAAERWLAAHVPPDAVIEVAGNPQFQARIPHQRTLLRTSADSLAIEPRGPRGDVVLVSSLDSYTLQRDPVVRAAWWDPLNAASGASYRPIVFSPGPVERFVAGLPVAPEVRIYVRSDVELR
jgi:hypothetical protein